MQCVNQLPTYQIIYKAFSKYYRNNLGLLERVFYKTFASVKAFFDTIKAANPVINTLTSGRNWGFSRQNNRIARGFAHVRLGRQKW